MIRTLILYLLAAAYLAVGISHLLRPEGFIAITPHWVPFPAEVVRWTGIAEIAGAIGLVTPRRLISWARPVAGIGLALYALLVWPANINHAINAIPLNGKTLGWGYHGPRLIAQPLVIWLALWVSGVIDWPFKRRD